MILALVLVLGVGDAAVTGRVLTITGTASTDTEAFIIVVFNNAIIDNVLEARLHFGARGRLVLGDRRPSLKCAYKADSFTKDPSIGNGKLSHPIALITADEVALAGCTWGGNCSHTFVINGAYYWTMSPGFLSAANSYIGLITASIDNVTPKWTSSGGVRPVVSLKSGMVIQSGYGTADLPFTIN